MNRLSILLFFSSLLLLASCAGDGSPVSAEGTSISTLGHGGSGFIGFFGTKAPNSKQSIIAALEIEGASGIEVDCQILADGHILLYHDQFLESQTHCEAEVAHAHWADIQHCGYDLISEDEDDRLWILDSLFAWCDDQKRPITLSLDIKMYPDGRNRDSLVTQISSSLSQTLDRVPFQGNLLVESTSSRLLRQLVKDEFQGKLFFYAQNVEKAILLDQEIGLSGVSIANENISIEEVIEAQAAGLDVMIFGARNSSLNEEVVAKKPDYIQTDDLEHLVNLVNPATREE